MDGMPTYTATRDRVEAYFNQAATQTWARLTSDAPVSRIRQTVRAGRDQMRATILSRLPTDLTGMRILDAGCGAGQMTADLAARGADVVATDISPALVGIAQARLPTNLVRHVTFKVGDMLAPALGRFDHVVAMDSMIYYTAPDLARAIAAFDARVDGSLIFTVAPRTPMLMALWTMGRLFPQADRAPTMVPHDPRTLAAGLLQHGASGALHEIKRIARGFYISTCLEYRR